VQKAEHFFSDIYADISSNEAPLHLLSYESYITHTQRKHAEATTFASAIWQGFI